MTTKNTGIVALTRGLNPRLEDAESVLTELSKSATHFEKNLDKRLEEIEKLEHAVSEADTEIQSLQARRDELRNGYLEASFNGDTDAQREVTSERQGIDNLLQQHTFERDKATASLNQIRSSVEDARSKTREALDALTIPNDAQLDDFINALVESFTQLRESLLERVQAVERGFE